MDNKMNVLVVEDSSSWVELLKGFFLFEGHDLTVVSSVQKAKEAMKQAEFDCFIVDADLKTMADGWEFARMLESQLHQVAILTGSGIPVFRKGGFDTKAFQQFIQESVFQSQD